MSESSHQATTGNPADSLGGIRVIQYVGAVLLFSGFVGAMWLPVLGLASVLSLFVFASAYMMIRRRVRCPYCGHDLSYLVMDANYSRNNYAILVCPRRLPADVVACPKCGEAFA